MCGRLVLVRIELLGLVTWAGLLFLLSGACSETGNLVQVDLETADHLGPADGNDFDAQEVVESDLFAKDVDPDNRTASRPCEKCVWTAESGVVCAPVDPGEGCDDGDCCTTNDYCVLCDDSEPGCLEYGVKCVGKLASCDDFNSCTIDSCSCVKAEATCIRTNVVDGLPCKNTEGCTTEDKCRGGVCVPGITIDSDDGDICTEDKCDNGVVVHIALSGTPCDDYEPCTTDDTCYLGACMPGALKECAKGVCASSAYCEPGVGCSNVWAPSGSTCNDGNACTVGDHCNSEHTCVGTLLKQDCDDGDPCTSDYCDTLSGQCSHDIIVGLCDDNDPCTEGDQCSPSGICSGQPVQCQASDNPCMIPICSKTTGHCGVPTSDGVSCADGNFCNGSESCSGGVCVPGVPVVCPEDGDPCTAEFCSPDVSACVVEVLTNVPCSDGDLCNGDDSCVLGSCFPIGEQLECDDGNMCTFDGCLVAFGCVHMPQPVGCDDGMPCTINDVCTDGECVGTTLAGCSQNEIVFAIDMPQGAPIALSSGELLVSLEVLAVSNGQTEPANLLNGSKPAMVLYMPDGSDTPYLLSVVEQGTSGFVSIDSLSTAATMVMMGSGGFALPRYLQIQLKDLIVEHGEIQQLADAIDLALVGNENPLDAAANGVMESLGISLLALEDWLAEHPLVVEPDDDQVLKALAGLTVSPSGRVGGFKLTPSVYGTSVKLSLDNGLVRSGKAVLKRTLPTAASIKTVDVAPGDFTYTQTLLEMVGLTDDVVVHSTTTFGTIATEAGKNQFQLTVLAPTFSANSPPSPQYMSLWREACYRTFFDVFVWPLVEIVLGEVAPSTVACYYDLALSAYHNLQASIDVTQFSLGNILSASSAIITTINGSGSCLLGKSGFWKKIASAFNKIGDIFEIGEYITGGVMSILSTMFSAPAQVQFTVNVCRPDCGARECGTEPICLTTCGPACPVGKVCTTDGKCIADCDSNYCQDNGLGSGKFCSNSATLVTCGTAGGCYIETSSQPCTLGCQSGACKAATCGDGVCTNGTETPCSCQIDCGPCSGCCSSGQCQAGTANSNCGTGGGTCDICVAGETCTNGVCKSSAEVCGNGACGSGETACTCQLDCGQCQGCCSSSTCITTPNDSACGKNGQVCVACGSNENCENGSCNASQSCNDGSCDWNETSCNCPQDCGACLGCCAGDDCESGTSGNACGSWGDACVSCPSGLCTNQQCSGTVCTSHAGWACSGGDVYYKDSCGNLEDKKDECGSCACSAGACSYVSHYSTTCILDVLVWVDCKGQETDTIQQCDNCDCSSGVCGCAQIYAIDGCNGSNYVSSCASNCQGCKTEAGFTGYNQTGCGGLTCFTKYPSSGINGFVVMYARSSQTAYVEWAFPQALSGNYRIYADVPSYSGLAAPYGCTVWNPVTNATYHIKQGSSDLATKTVNHSTAKGTAVLLYEGNATGVTAVTLPNVGSPTSCGHFLIDRLRAEPY